MLMLMQQHAYRQDDERAYAKHIRQWLKSSNGRPVVSRRAVVDAGGCRVAALIAECSAICVRGSALSSVHGIATLRRRCPRSPIQRRRSARVIPP